MDNQNKEREMFEQHKKEKKIEEENGRKTIAYRKRKENGRIIENAEKQRVKAGITLIVSKVTKYEKSNM